MRSEYMSHGIPIPVGPVLWRRLPIFLLMIALPLLVLPARTQEVATLADESRTTLQLNDPPHLRVTLREAGPQTVQVELLDPEGGLLARGQLLCYAVLCSGDIPAWSSVIRSRLAGELYRDRLRIQAGDKSSTVAVSQASTEFVVLQSSIPEDFVPGANTRLLVQAMDLRSQTPLPNQPVTIELRSAALEDARVSASGVTDPAGLADLLLKVPESFISQDAELVLRTQRGLVTTETTQDVNVRPEFKFISTTDKPMYQPGQVLHMRTVLTAGRKVLAGVPVTITVLDPEDINVFAATIKTSAYGVASASWPIPENIRLGNYAVTFRAIGGVDDRRGTARREVKISRYEIPQFSVKAEGVKPYFLADEPARIRLEASYLFGQPVRRGQFRILKNRPRPWNYREQRLDPAKDAEEVLAGTLDEGGRFVGELSIAEADRDVGVNTYLDAEYEAFVTDPTTNRTENIRFDLRFSQHDIHIYTARSERSPGTRGESGPRDFYVITTYADGRPARAQVKVYDDEDDLADRPRPRRVVYTNKYGVARVTGIRLEGNYAAFTARDADGKKGQVDEFPVYAMDDQKLWLRPRSVLLQPGQAIVADAFSAAPSIRTLVAELHVGRSILAVREVALQRGRGAVRFPHTPEMRGAVRLLLYDPHHLSEGRVAHTTLLYPDPRALNITLQPGRKQYRPGEEAWVGVSVAATDGRRVQSALAAVVLDRGIELRANSDAELNRDSFGYFCWYFDDWNQSIGDVSISSLLERDPRTTPDPDLELVAQALAPYGHYWYRTTQTNAYDFSVREEHYRKLIDAGLVPLLKTLKEDFQSTQRFPHSEADLRRQLRERGHDLDSIRDPWGRPYRYRWWFNHANESLVVRSAGPDQAFETKDDFDVSRPEFSVPFFQAYGATITTVSRAYHQRTGDYLRTRGELAAELALRGIDLDSLVSPYGTPYDYHFSTRRQRHTIAVKTTVKDADPRDSFTIWESSIPYFEREAELIRHGLTAAFVREGRFPESQEELDNVFRAQGVPAIADFWRSPIYFTFRVRYLFADQVAAGAQGVHVTPVTRAVREIDVRSRGEDRKEGTTDDFTILTISRTETERSAAAQGVTTAETRKARPGMQGRGVVAGVVFDPSGAVVANARITLQKLDGNFAQHSRSDTQGEFQFADLVPGEYSLSIEAPGFQSTMSSPLTVQGGDVVTLSVTLKVGSTSVTVEVTAEAALVNTSTSSLSMTVEGRKRTSPRPAAFGAGAVLSTPRLRKYFPETAYWSPETITDASGKAQFRWTMPDNMTSWRVRVLATTASGEFGTAETEVIGFQPFFADHDPPRILTEGDQIALPVVLRNYLPRPLRMQVEMRSGPWFKLLGEPVQHVEIPRGEGARAIFPFQASRSVKAGKQSVSAREAAVADAIEREVTVHPDGAPREVTYSAMLRGPSSFTFHVDADAIAGSLEGELRIYPSLKAHVAENVEAIMQRPYGCAEQTISAAYASLLYLDYSPPAGPLAERARSYLRSGVDRLLSYRAATGGFGYWSFSDADPLLTAYALSFLRSASRFTTVDDTVIDGARAFLEKSQAEDGSWQPRWSWGDKRRIAVQHTSYVLRVLAALPQPEAKDKAAKKDFAILRAKNFLRPALESSADPYDLAQYLLALRSLNESAEVPSIVARLVSSGKRETEGSAYWNVERNTPFYGWGRAGRIETTALVMEALLPERSAEAQSSVSQAANFLIQGKDGYGMWYSGQATINVLRAMLRFAGDQPADAGLLGVLVNGSAVTLPAPGHAATFLRVPLNSLKTGENSVQISGLDPGAAASVQAVTRYYSPWKDAARENVKASGNSALQLTVVYDRKELKVGESVAVSVKAERIGFVGYGMMIAEVGLPPGADVDRESLELARRNSGEDWWPDIQSVDILPDRVLFYLWPRAGGTSFTFRFRPRYGIVARTAGSELWDYYNPEARTQVAPVTFRVVE